MHGDRSTLGLVLKLASGYGFDDMTEVQLYKVLQSQQWSPNPDMRVVQDRDLVVHNQVDLAQLRACGHHQLDVILDLPPLT